MLIRIVAALSVACALARISGAQDWQRLGPEGGIVVSLGAGGGGTVYLGAADGHVFASEDDASSWELRGRVGSRLDAVVTRLLADPEDEKQVMAAVWFRDAAENGGVFRSDDGGRNWRSTGLEGEAVRALEQAPSKRSDLVAGSRSGVFRSRDNGASWQRISPEGDLELRNVDSVAIDPRDPDVIYVGTYHLPWRTKDGGKSWEPVIAGIIDDSDIMSLRLDSTSPDRVYMSACSGIYRSENQGTQWTKLQGIPYAARRTQTIVQDSLNTRILYAGTTEGAWVTRDSGETWARTTPKDWVVNSVLVLTGRASHPGRIVMGTESGIQVSDDNGEIFAASNRGFAHAIVKQLVAGFGDTGGILALVQRNGWELLKSRNLGREWIPVPLAEARPGQSSLSADEIEQLLGSPWGWMLRMADGHFWIQDEQGTWRQWKPRAGPEAASSKGSPANKTASTRPLPKEIATGTIAFSGESAIIATREGVARCEKSGVCRYLKAFRGSTPRAIWTSRSGNEMAVLQDEKLGLSSDGGATASWRDLPVAGKQSLWVEQSEWNGQQTLLLGTNIGLFLSHDAGEHWVPAQNGLPAGRMDSWKADGKEWLVSERSGGLYLSRDRGESWSRLDRDSERGRYAGFVKTGSQEVLAGSESEGILEVRFPSEK